nr:patatin family protein [Lachnospiraceae bacterium]
MKKNIYSRLAEIPEGNASDIITEGCLVLEGGAFRSLYTQGFLDAMMVHDLNIRCVIGVSAGALSGMNYVAGQIGRSARLNLSFRHDSRYVGPKALVHSHSIVDVGFLTEERGIYEPLNRKRFDDPSRRFIAVTTNCLNGKATCFEKGKCSDIMQAVRAS